MRFILYHGFQLDCEMNPSYFEARPAKVHEQTSNSSGSDYFSARDRNGCAKYEDEDPQLPQTDRCEARTACRVRTVGKDVSGNLIPRRQQLVERRNDQRRHALTRGNEARNR